MSLQDHDRSRLLELLTQLSFQRRSVKLASGRTSNFYVDCKETALSAEGHLLIGRQLFAAIQAFEARTKLRVGGVGGLTLGADPIASAVSLTSALAGAPIPAFIVRKEAKGHGTEAWLEGTKNLAPGSTLVVVEDVITTGGSALKAVTRVREAGFQVPLCLALVDRQEGGREAIEQEGLEVHSLYTRRDFMGDED